MTMGRGEGMNVQPWPVSVMIPRGYVMTDLALSSYESQMLYRVLGESRFLLARGSGPNPTAQGSRLLRSNDSAAHRLLVGMDESIR
jgi:hypothetical protein